MSTKLHSFRCHRVAAFTLIELLISITVIAILTSMILVGVKNVRSRAAQVNGISNIRGVYAATALFCGDHNGSLPGPVDTGVRSTYKTSGQTNAIAYQLSPYIATTAVTGAYTIVPALASTIAQKYTNNYDPTKGVVQYRLSATKFTDSNFTYPFGHPVSGSAGDTPVKKLALIPEPSRNVMMCDMDIQNAPDVSWKTDVPTQPIYGDTRMYLFFDGHTERRPLTDATLVYGQ